jgi:hypothetical protein
VKPAFLLSLSLSVVTGLQAQNYAPVNANTTEQNSRNNYPFQRTGARVQNFVDASEFTSAGFVSTALSFRWDGATAGSGGSATFATFRMEVGTTPRAWNAIGGNFAANRVGSTVRGSFSAAAYNFMYPSAITTQPKPWGASDLDNKLRFPFAAPAPIAIPAGGCAFFDIWAATRTGGSSNALVDFHQDGTGGMGAGTQVTIGTGCPASATGTAATLLAAGQLATGTAVSVYGAGYEANRPMVTVVSATQQNPPILLPGTASCNIHVGLAGVIMLPGTTSATGSTTAYENGTFLGIPQGVVGTIYLQRAAAITPYAGNTLGLQTSNGRSLTIAANTATGAAKGWFAGHHLSDQAEGPSFCAHGVYAMRWE